MVTCQAEERRRTPPNPGCMSALPDHLDVERNVELRGYRFYRPVRYALLGLLGAFLVLGLLNVFGQRPHSHTYSSPGADVELQAPATLRSGLFYQARFTIAAKRTVSHAVLVLSSGWAESQTINTIEPGPMAETSHDGALALTLGTIPAGRKHTLFLELQVNPTNVGHRAADFTLYDGDARLLTVHRTITIYP
jgi:hypothetical protein